MAYDLVIRDALVVDGSGLPGYMADVAVRNGRIAEIGKVRDQARRVIQADGLVLAPGFIDHHTHLDAQLLWDPLASSSPYHGVTTVVTGNCGLTLMPCKPEHRDALVSTLARVEAIPREVLEMAVDWRWGSAGEYMDALDRRLAVNVACLVGHCAVRQYVMGDDATEREATEDEIVAMQELVRAAMRSGAVGFSTNQNPRHMRLDGKPVPSRLASEREVLELAAAAGEFNTGVIQAIRNTRSVEDVDWYAQLSRASGRPVLWNIVVHTWAAPNQWRRQLDRLEEVFRQGVRPYALTNVFPFIRRFTLRNAQAFDEFPAWRSIMLAPLEDRRRAFAEPATREVLRREIKEFTGQVNFHRRWDLISLTQAKLPSHQRFRGMSVADIARHQDKDELDAFLDMSLAEDLETVFQTSSAQGDVDAVRAILQSPYVVIGESDAGAHVAFDAAFGYCTTLLGHWVRERKLMSLEAAVHKLTFMVASLFGMMDRGLVQPGYAADLVLFDPSTVVALEPEEAWDYPGNTRRMVQGAVGVHSTIVNGRVIVENGEYTGALPGRVLRRSWHAARNGEGGWPARKSPGTPKPRTREGEG